jgi:hypothetical protein
MLQEEESFPNLTELVLLKDTWAIIRAQVIVIQKIYVGNELKNNTFNPLKGQCHEIFDFWFFHESVSPKPLIIPLGPFVWTPLGSRVNLYIHFCL